MDDSDVKLWKGQNSITIGNKIVDDPHKSDVQSTRDFFTVDDERNICESTHIVGDGSYKGSNQFEENDDLQLRDSNFEYSS